MSISPPSDIILDVTRAADPVKMQAGLRKLVESARGTSFEEAMAGGPVSPSPAVNGLGVNGLGVNGLGSLGERMRPIVPRNDPTGPAKAYEGLEAFLLQTMIGAMLPQKAEQSFGKGLAGGVFKSMLAEHLANGMEKTGGIGIAKHLLARAGDSA